MSYPEKNYGNAAMAAQSAYNTVTAPPTPTRFSNCAGQLEAHLSHLQTMIERLSSVADRLGGPVPEEAGTPKQIRGGGNVASQIEASLEDLETLTRRASHVVERLERL